MLAMEKTTSTLSLLNYVQAGHGNDTTLWLLQAEIKVLLSVAGESKTSNKFSPSDSSLLQQLHAGEETQEVLSLKLPFQGLNAG